jgi:hypothetical protein
MTTEKEQVSSDKSDECVVHTHPVPAGELSRYSVEGDQHSEADIANYVSGQARDEIVQHIEKIKQESCILCDKFMLIVAYESQVYTWKSKSLDRAWGTGLAPRHIAGKG